MPSHEQLFQSIFNREFSSEQSTDVLKDAAKEYPFFIPAHFFLLKKDIDNKEQAAVTSLLFNDPLWLNWQLVNGDEQKEVEMIPVKEEILHEVELPKEEPIIEVTNTEITGTGIAMLHEEPASAIPTLRAVEKQDELIFEPLYASDYFASQGIKLSEEIKADDKIGRQLKSFTEWLKTMKKVEPAKLMQDTAPVDIAVQNLAEKSNTEGEVLTETMAEVFAQQGKAAKAAEVYEKLSLLNPLKSAYFAAKIEQLKSI